jgi:hypothetical protein
MEISFISNVQKLGHKKYSILGCSNEKVGELVTCAFSLHLDNLVAALFCLDACSSSSKLCLLQQSVFLLGSLVLVHSFQCRIG